MVGSKHVGVYNASMADGSVRFFSRMMPRETLKAMITRDGGELIQSRE
ncbi:MAG: H-X9-DG-CTERM domain-containing protein [bacterium]